MENNRAAYVAGSWFSVETEKNGPFRVSVPPTGNGQLVHFFYSDSADEAVRNYRNTFQADDRELVVYKVVRLGTVPPLKKPEPVKTQPPVTNPTEPVKTEAPPTQPKTRKNPRRPKYRYAIVKSVLDGFIKDPTNLQGDFLHRRAIDTNTATIGTLDAMLALASLKLDRKVGKNTTPDYLALKPIAREVFGVDANNPYAKIPSEDFVKKLKILLRRVR